MLIYLKKLIFQISICLYCISSYAYAKDVSDNAKRWGENNPEIYIVADSLLPPFDFINDAGEHIGLGKSIVDRLSNILPFSFIYLPNAPFDEQIAKVASNEAQVFSLCATTTAKKHGLLTSRPVVVKNSYLVKKATGSINKLDDIRPKHVIGYGAGYATEKDAKAIDGDPQKKPFTSVEAGIIALNSNKIDGFVTDAGQANYWVSRHIISDIELLKIPNANSMTLAFCVSPKNPELVEWLNFGLDTIGDKQLKKLEVSWVGVNTKEVILTFRKSQRYIILTIALTMTIALIGLIWHFFYSQRKNTHKITERFGSDRFRNAYIIGLLLISCVLIAMTMMILKNYRLSAIDSYSDSLDISLMSTDRRLNDWFGERSALISQVANLPEIKELTWVLNELDKSNYPISGSKELENLRKHIEKQAIISELAEGYYLLNTQGNVIAGKYDDTLGKISLFYEQAPEKINTIFSGRNVFISPIYSDIDMDGNTNAKDEDPVLMIGVPINSFEGNEITAALLFTFNPRTQFSRLFRSAHTGKTGEAYAINEQGTLVSKTRMFNRMSSKGKIPLGESEILQISVPKHISSSPYYGVQNYNSGENLEGYLNYNNNKVIGKWFWHPLLEIMIVAEIEEQEVFLGYQQSQTSLWFITILALSTITLVSVFMFLVGRRAHQVQVNSNRDLERLVKERTQELAKSEQDNRLILGSVTDGILGINKEGECSYINRSAEKILKLTSNQVTGNILRNFLKVYDQTEQEVLTRNVNHSLYSGEVFLGQSHHVMTQNTLNIAIEYSINPIIVDGNIIGAVVIMRDITNEEKVKGALVEAKQLAVEASNSKSNFLANMSHEIRTPMNAIIGMSYLAMQGNIDEKTQNYVTKVNRSANNLLGIINDILDFSKIEAGKIELEEITFNLDEILEDLSTIVSTKTEEKGLELLFQIDPNIPMELIGDPLRINQILTNLTSNSVKFTEQGGITISASLKEDGAQNIKILFIVKDSGIGMSEEQISKLFQSFSQADSSTTRKYGGTGLGLSISKSLVGQMGGEIWVESEPSVGSVFYFTLTLKKSANRSTFIQQGGKTILDGKRVLVVDDSQSSIDVHKEIMESFGCQVYSANSGQQAIELAQKVDFDFDIALIDWKMPEMDGVETYKQLKAAQGKAMKHAVLVSSHKQDAAGDKDIKASFDSLIAKPVTPSSLFNGLRKLIATETSQHFKQQNKNATQDAIENLAGYKVLLVEDNDLNQELATELLKQAQITVEQAENGEEAVQAVKENTYDAVLMDIQMPIMDGYEATKLIREFNAQIPIIAMTANAMASDREKVLKAGMDAHIAKPINVKEMYSTLGNCIKEKSTVKEASSHKEPSSSEEPIQANPVVKPLSFTVIDVQKGMEVCNNSESLYRRLLSRFLNGQEAFSEQFNSAIQEPDWLSATRIAHTLKGSAGNIGASKLYNSSSTLEHLTQQKIEDNTTEMTESETLNLTQCMEAVVADLQDVINDINGEELLSMNSQAQHEAENKEALLSLSQQLTEIDKLIVYIEDFDTEAVELAKTIEKSVLDSELKNEFKLLIKALHEYDFEIAVDSVQEIKVRLEKMHD